MIRKEPFFNYNSVALYVRQALLPGDEKTSGKCFEKTKKVLYSLTQVDKNYHEQMAVFGADWGAWLPSRLSR